jgi:2'-5' RNA ligase
MTRPGDLGPPSERSALIIRARLPAALEGLRRRGAHDAVAGVPAHLTLLFPFITPEQLDRRVRDRVAAVCATHEPFDYILAGQARWPDAVYVAVEPAAPFVGLQHAFARAFPQFPIYGTDASFEFVPHVTIAEGPAVDDDTTRTDPAWLALPRPGRTTAVEAIARAEGGRWQTVWRIRLGGRRRSARR